MITIEVQDMSCSHCVGAITRAVKGVDQDATLQVDLATHRVQIEPAAANAEQLVEAIRDAGYTPVPVAAA